MALAACSRGPENSIKAMQLNSRSLVWFDIMSKTKRSTTACKSTPDMTPGSDRRFIGLERKRPRRKLSPIAWGRRIGMKAHDGAKRHDLKPARHACVACRGPARELLQTRRSAGSRSMQIPVRMRLSRTCSELHWDSPSGCKCQRQSTTSWCYCSADSPRYCFLRAAAEFSGSGSGSGFGSGRPSRAAPCR